MTILEAIELGNSQAGVKSFAFANISEFNEFMHSFESLDYPCHVVQPLTTSVAFLSGRTKTSVTVNGWFLKRINQDTTNFRSAKIESDHMEPMRALCKRFIKYLLQSSDIDIIDPEVDSIVCTIRPEYAFLPARLFGVSYTLTLPVVESIC